MQVNLWVIAVVTFNVGVFVVLIQVLQVAFKLPGWLATAQRFFQRRQRAVEPLHRVPSQIDRLNRLIFSSNQRLQQLSQRVTGTLQVTQLGIWANKRRRK